MQFPLVVGLAGVSPNENPSALRWSQRLEWPMLLLSLWIILEWYLQARGHLDATTITVSDWTIWLFFVTETVLLTTLVDRKWEYLRNNWVNLVIIATGLPLLWWFQPAAGALRILRVLVMFSLILQMSGRARRMLSRNHVGPTIFAAFLLVVVSGFIVAGLDPGIGSPWEGIWWAWVTITTVGYGDIVPTTVEGRLFGAVLILMGIGLFSVMTASFSAFFVSEDKLQEVRNEQEMINRLELLQTRMDRLEKKLDALLLSVEKPERDLEP